MEQALKQERKMLYDKNIFYCFKSGGSSVIGSKNQFWDDNQKGIFLGLGNAIEDIGKEISSMIEKLLLHEDMKLEKDDLQKHLLEINENLDVDSIRESLFSLSNELCHQDSKDHQEVMMENYQGIMIENIDEADKGIRILIDCYGSIFQSLQKNDHYAEFSKIETKQDQYYQKGERRFLGFFPIRMHYFGFVKESDDIPIIAAIESSDWHIPSIRPWSRRISIYAGKHGSGGEANDFLGSKPAYAEKNQVLKSTENGYNLLFRAITHT